MSEAVTETPGRHALQNETPETAQITQLPVVDPVEKTQESGRHRITGRKRRFDPMHLMRPLIALGLTLPATQPENPTVEGKLIPPPDSKTSSSDSVANVPATSADTQSEDFSVATGDAIASQHK